MEYCKANAPLGSGEVVTRITQQFPDVRIEAWDCLDYCDICCRRPCVLVDERNCVSADTPDALWTLVESHLLG